MNAHTIPSEDSGKLSLSWTQEDDAEYNRLSTEMADDAKMQFTLFTFSITTSTAVLGFLIGTALGANSLGLFGLPPGAFFLVPLIVLLPTSWMILNRARTRNRKVAYIIICFDYKRLCAEGITNRTPLDEVRRYPFLPWETALHILDRTNLNADPPRQVHLARPLRYMTLSYFAIETFCIALAIYTSLQTSWSVLLTLGLIVIGVLLLSYYRFKALMELKARISIQGYVEQWLQLKFGKISDAPLYLQQWLEEYNRKKPQGPPRP